MRKRFENFNICYNIQMQQLIDSYKKSKDLHHAYFLVGDAEEIFLKLKDFFEKSVGIKTSGNPDFWHGKFDTLTIDSARDIAFAQERKSFSPSTSSGPSASPTGKIFVITTDFITIEAQNSLLKVFEEPTAGTHFFIISPQDILLPTLRSRMQVVLHSSELASMSKTVFDMTLKERLEEVKKITDAIGDEEATKQDAIVFLNQIEKELYKNGSEKSAKSLEVCQLARLYLYDRGAPIKIILENLMLSI